MQLGALLGMASFCIWVGSKRSYRKDEEEEGETETITTADAMKFPLFASCALFSIYCLFRFVNPEMLALLLAGYFSLIGTASLQFAISPIVTRLLFPLWKCVGDKVVVRAQDGKEEDVVILEFTRGDVISAVVGASISAVYVFTRHWIVTNMIAMSIVIGAMQVLKLDSFKAACILLSGLLLYDIFWVFGTDVMLTVSKSVDGPIKILFPSDIVTGGIFSKRLGMLGLGDIMIPGVVVAMLYRFDMKRGAGPDAPTPYFYAAFIAYMMGLILTFIILHVWQHPQPALLYLSPIGMLTPLCQALLRGEVKELFEYGEDQEDSDETDPTAVTTSKEE